MIVVGELMVRITRDWDLPLHYEASPLEPSIGAVGWLAETAGRQNAELLIANSTLNPVSVPGRVSAWPLIEKPEDIRAAEPVGESVREIRHVPESSMSSSTTARVTPACPPTCHRLMHP